MAQVQGEEIYLAHSGQEVDDNIDEVVAARGSEESLSARLADIVSDFEADQQRQETEIGAVAALGAKNLFNIYATPTVNHTDYTLTDGKLTVTANGNWAHYSVPLNLPAGNYVLSAVISGYSKASGAPDTSMRLRMSATTSGGTNIVLQTVSENGSMSVPFEWTGGTIYLQFYPDYNATTYANSFAVENTMIRRAEIADDSYAPYAPTNRELYEAKITLEDVFGTGKLIPDNADLDAYTIIGKYYGGNSAGNTVLHLPVENGSFTFSLEVRQATTSMTYQYLRICRLADDPYIYIRRKYTTWGTWYRFTGEVAAAVQSAAASLMQSGRLDPAELTDAGTGEEDEER